MIQIQCALSKPLTTYRAAADNVLGNELKSRGWHDILESLIFIGLETKILRFLVLFIVNPKVGFDKRTYWTKVECHLPYIECSLLSSERRTHSVIVFWERFEVCSWEERGGTTGERRRWDMLANLESRVYTRHSEDVIRNMTKNKICRSDK